MEIALSIFLGIGLAASAGLRVFLPLLVANIAHYAGWVNFSDGFDWMGSLPAFIVFLSATLIEVAAYYVPWLDNALDTAAVPLSAIAGTLLSVSFITGVDPVFQWILGIIAGGGTAALVKTASAATRAGSSATTGGLGNWIVSSVENIASLIMSLISVLVPIVAGILIAGFIIYRLQKIAVRKTSESGSN
ncbi:MAG: DUF4126 domain-containing protein [Ignavibacteria bacterium]|nr:DUF4126 domain-containing protein [Ignavibacteria bacterium]